nr:MAG TPA: DNA directed DNA polymerase [Caudoviricetes sp.]
MSIISENIDLIREELNNNLPIPDSFNHKNTFRYLSFKNTAIMASKRPSPKPLFLNLWYEGEVCCLFSDSNLGKSIFAVQIATELDKKHKVVLFDCELSDKQFQIRYTNDQGVIHDFGDNLIRAEIDPEGFYTSDIEGAIMSGIEDVAVEVGADVVIIDNITFLCSNAEKSDAAGILMLSLTRLKRKYGWSILVLAHTPKRSLFNPITQNDLAGSKKLYNFFDSAFAIGKSAKDESLRYVKQLKVRNGPFEYGEDNVLLYSIEKEDTFLHFKYHGTGTEREHLRELTDKEIKNIDSIVKGMNSNGKSVRQIAYELGISKSKVGRILEKAKEGDLFTDQE